MNRKIPREQIEFVIQNGGKMTNTEIQKRTGISLPTIAKIMKEAGIPSNGRGRPKSRVIEASSASSNVQDTDTPQE